jgi:outer membrane immunogenic protein
MNSLRIAGISLLACMGASSALAADIPMKAPLPVRTVEVVYNWTGFYIGVNAGYGWSRDRSVTFSNITGTLVSPGGVPGVVSFDTKGAVAGGQIGYNVQSGMFLFGIEADADYANISGGATAFGLIDVRRSSTGDQRLNAFATLRGRLGLVQDRFLGYVTGGLAVGSVKSTASFSNTDGCTFPGGGANQCPTGSVSKSLAGYTLGGGAEFAFDRSWSIKGEYLYYNLGNVSYTLADANFPGVTYGATTEFRGHIIRGGINYRFDAGPVIARY